MSFGWVNFNELVAMDNITKPLPGSVTLKGIAPPHPPLEEITAQKRRRFWKPRMYIGSSVFPQIIEIKDNNNYIDKEKTNLFLYHNGPYRRFYECIIETICKPLSGIHLYFSIICYSA